jgi:chemotaxis protein MotB
MSIRARRHQRSADIWPGFVDALSTLLMVIIFLLVVFMLAQFFLSVALSRSDDALNRLSLQVAELADLLSLERQANAGLRLDIAQLSAELQSSLVTRDQLSTELADVTGERDMLNLQIARLTTERDEFSARLTTVLSDRDALELRLGETIGRATEAEAEAEALRAALAEAERTIETDKETIELKLAELASLRNDIAALRQVRAELEAQVSQLAAVVEVNEDEIARLEAEGETAREENRLLIVQVDETGKALEVTKGALEESETTLARLVEEHRLLILRAGETDAALAESAASLSESSASLSALRVELTSLRDRSKELAARLASEAERTALAQTELEERDMRLGELTASLRASEEDLLGERDISAEALAQVELLNRQIAALRQQLARIAAALEVAETQVDDQKVIIANLGQRLNLALAGKVEELQRYRSEFFGRLREALGNRPGIRVEGDRFVFQSEVLFASGSAELGSGGQAQLIPLATTLIEIADEIPSELNWILRVDGHTDKRPIHTAAFPSNWELSTARAMSVVRFLISRGVPPHRLAPTGFGEFQPLDLRDDEIAYRRNRRIELKLTDR